MTIDKLQLDQTKGSMGRSGTQFQKTFVFVTFFLVSWLIGLYGTAAYTDLQHLAYTAIDAPLFWQPSTVSLRFTFNHKTMKAKLTTR